MALGLQVPIHIVRTCLVEAECVEQILSDELSKARHFQTDLFRKIVLFNCFHVAFGLAQGYPVVW